MEFLTLYNGVKIPAIGSGTNNFGRSDSDRYESELNGDYSAMVSALEVGYRMFDTAMIYGNEEGIGECMKKSGIAREEFFIMGKIPNQDPWSTTREAIRKSVDDSLKNLGIEQFDMFLIHKAIPTDVERAGGKMNVERTVELWEALVDLMGEGKFRGIGVSNFNVEQLQALMSKTSVVPMVDEIRCNPAMRNTETVEFCKANKIQPVAHSPLSFSVAPGVFKIDEGYKLKLADIGAKYNKSWAQVQLRYNFQNGVCSIPRSSKIKNQAANLDIFDFALTAEDMEQLSH